MIGVSACCVMMRPMTFEDDREMAVALGTSGVMAAMSGGVDSSVCALLLQEAGYAVRGATMVLRDDQESTCGSSRDVEDAREVCQRLGIPHDAFDLRDRFDAAVVRPFCDAYLEGRTPNPCIACNRFLKFESLQQRRRELPAARNAPCRQHGYAHRLHDLRNERHRVELADVPARLPAFGDDGIGAALLHSPRERRRGNDRNDLDAGILPRRHVGCGASRSRRDRLHALVYGELGQVVGMRAHEHDVEREWPVCSRLRLVYLTGHDIGACTSPGQYAKAASIADGRGKRCIGNPCHRALEDGVLDAEKLGDASPHRALTSTRRRA